jgi:hypothetical protein
VVVGQAVEALGQEVVGLGQVVSVEEARALEVVVQEEEALGQVVADLDHLAALPSVGQVVGVMAVHMVAAWVGQTALALQLLPWVGPQQQQQQEAVVCHSPRRWGRAPSVAGC